MTTVAVSLKMYFGPARAQAYCATLASLAARHPEVVSCATELVVLPSFVAIPAAVSAARNTRLRVGAQDLATEDAGAFTGEVSGAELAELGVTHVEVGHAERRRLFGEDDTVVCAKTAAALRNGLVPLLCVGETERMDLVAAAAAVVDQVASAVPDFTDQRVLVAYEPVWAIGAAEPGAARVHLGGMPRRPRRPGRAPRQLRHPLWRQRRPRTRHRPRRLRRRAVPGAVRPRPLGGQDRPRRARRYALTPRRSPGASLEIRSSVPVITQRTAMSESTPTTIPTMPTTPASGAGCP